MNTRRTILAPLALASLALAGCSDSPSGPGGGPGGRDVAITFGVARSGAALSEGVSRAAQGDQLVVTGANGTLTITDVRIVVEEFELKGDDDVNPCEESGGGDDCEDFEAGPMFVDLPLSGEQVPVSTGAVPPGTYRELEFEIEDLDDDEENPAERQRIEELRQEILAQFPDFPRDASMLVEGTFTPAGGGAARPFRVFIEAEVEIEIELQPRLVVTGGSPTQEVSVELNVASLFRSGGNVIDLSALNGRTIEIEQKIKSGFSGGGDDDDNSGPGGGDDDDDD
jgi:hypothetical protein